MAIEPGWLEGVELLRTLTGEDRRALAATMDVHPAAKGAVLFRQGDAGDSLFIVRSGLIELYVQDHAGQEIVLHHAGEGEVFGELSLLDGRPRTAAARVVDEGELLVLERDDLIALVKRSPELALDILAMMSRETRRADELLRARVTRNVNEEAQEQMTPLQRAADLIAEFSGSMGFLMMNAVWFVIWIALNTMHLGIEHFDPYPFGLLTMIVSLEAIFLSCFVLISQNVQAAKDRVRGDVEYDVNIKAEMEVAHLHGKLDRIQEQLVEKLDKLERKLPR
jgi:uncharacterized membrane protein